MTDTSSADGGPLAVGAQQAKSARAQEAICAAATDLLAAVGYAETSQNRVAKQAGFSKGALQHHYPTKEDLVAHTLDRLLMRTFEPSGGRSVDSVEDALMTAWRRFINTDGYRALMEILHAARTDAALSQRLSAPLLAWGKRLDAQATERYVAVSGRTDDVVMLLNMTRSFMRGLLVQERYGVTSKQTDAYVRKWIELVAPLLRLRESDDSNTTKEKGR